MNILGEKIRGPKDPTYNNKPITKSFCNSQFIIDYENIETVPVLENKILVSKVSNLLIKKIGGGYPDPQDKELDSVFFITVKDYAVGYFHLIWDILAEFELLKNIIPNIKLKIFMADNDFPFKFFIKTLQDKGILEAYKIATEDFIDPDEINELRIKSFYFVYTSKNYFASLLADYPCRMFPESAVHAWGQASVNGLKNKFLKSETTKDQKLFISGLADNDLKRELTKVMKKVLDKKPISQDEEDMLGDFVITFDGFGNRKKRNLNIGDFDSTVLLDWTCRMMPKYQERLLEKLFERAGYTVINPDDVGDIFNQAHLFNSAKYIIGLSGASFVNSCFCNEDVKLLILNNCKRYRFPHEQVAKSFGVNAKIFPGKGEQQLYTNDARQMFAWIQEKHPEFFV